MRIRAPRDPVCNGTARHEHIDAVNPLCSVSPPGPQVLTILQPCQFPFLLGRNTHASLASQSVGRVILRLRRKVVKQISGADFGLDDARRPLNGV
jgi:hypothetical protein